MSVETFVRAFEPAHSGLESAGGEPVQGLLWSLGPDFGLLKVADDRGDRRQARFFRGPAAGGSVADEELAAVSPEEDGEDDASLPDRGEEGSEEVGLLVELAPLEGSGAELGVALSSPDLDSAAFKARSSVDDTPGGESVDGEERFEAGAPKPDRFHASSIWVRTWISQSCWVSIRLRGGIS